MPKRMVQLHLAFVKIFYLDSLQFWRHVFAITSYFNMLVHLT